MPGLHVTTQPLVNTKKPYPPNVGQQAERIQSIGLPGAQEMASALRAIQANLDPINAVLRNNNPQVDDIIVTDSAGRVIAALGEFQANGVLYDGGIFAELYAGYQLGITDPAQAIFTVTPDGKVQIGHNGWVDVLDPFGGSAAWLGTQYDTFNITGAVGASGLIRLTVTAHTLLTGDVVVALNVGGVPNATGAWSVTKIDANHVDLQNSVFDGAYTSGGTVDRLLHITGAANNGSGLVRITVTAHGYLTGEQVNLSGAGSNASGQWVIKVVDTNHFDLIGSTYSGAVTGAGTCLRYFAGGLYQTIAIGGTSFPTAKFRAMANGDLNITNALIKLVGSGTHSATITLDPSAGTITVQANSPDTGLTTITGGGIVATGSGTGSATVTIDSALGALTVVANSPSTIETLINAAGEFLFDTAGSQPGLLLASNSLQLASDVSYSGGIFSIAGNSATILPDTLTLFDFGNLNGVWLDISHGIRLFGSGAELISLSDGDGSISGKILDISGVHIDNTKHATGFASIDSAAYKIGGVAGVGSLGSFITNITFSSATFVTGVNFGASTVTTGTALTAIATISGISETFIGGLLTAATAF